MTGSQSSDIITMVTVHPLGLALFLPWSIICDIRPRPRRRGHGQLASGVESTWANGQDRGHWPGQSYQEFDLRTHNPTHLLVQTLPGEKNLLVFPEQSDPKIAHSRSKVYQTIIPSCYPLFNNSTHAGY